MVNTAMLYKPIMAISLYLFFFHFISLGAFPPFIIFIVAWVFILRSMNDDGSLVKFSYIIIVADLFTFTLRIGARGIEGIVYIIYLPLGILFVLMLISQIAINREMLYFNRTVQSMNPQDRALAVKAMKTKDPSDFAKVAEYTDWNTVS